MINQEKMQQILNLEQQICSLYQQRQALMTNLTPEEYKYWERGVQMIYPKANINPGSNNGVFLRR